MRRTSRKASRRMLAMRVGLQWARMSLCSRARPSAEWAVAPRMAFAKASGECSPRTIGYGSLG